VRIPDQARFLDREVDRRFAIRSEQVVGARGPDGVEPRPPGVGELGDVRPLVLDILAEELQRVERL
jgi:hypothetical protein